MARSNVVRLPGIPSLSWDDCRLLVESVIDYAIFMLDVEGHVATWNAGAEKIKGYAAIEIIGQSFERFYAAEDVAAGKPRRLLDAAKSEGRVEDEGWRVRKDGTRFWASVVITALRDESGNLRGFGKVTRDLTARRAAEQRLRESEQRFHHLVEGVLDYAIFMLDVDGRIATWNTGAQRAKGYTADEIVGQHFSVFYTAEDRAAGKPQRMLESAMREGRVEDEGWRVRKDGTTFWADVVMTALRDERGSLTGFAKVTRDLTQRRQAEETERRLTVERAAREFAEAAELQLRESEERYRALSTRLEVILEGVGDGITVQDRAGNIVYANSAAANMCGYATAEELTNASPADVVARFEMLLPDGRPIGAADLPARRVLAGEPSAVITLHVCERATRRDWWVQLRASPVLDAAGKPELAVNIWHDVTAQRRQEVAERILGEATAALGTSLDRSAMLGTLASTLVPAFGDWCSIYLLDGDELLNVATAHRDAEQAARVGAYRERFPADPAHAGGVWRAIRTGRPELWNDITDADLETSTTDPEALALLRKLGMHAAFIVPLRVRGRVTGAIVLVSGSRERRYDANDVAVIDELGRRAGVALENVRLYAAAQDAVKVAEEASRAKDEFLATVSHELRTPLNAIVGWASLLRHRTEDPAIAKPIEIIHRNARAQVRIIDDILDVSRVITGKLRIDPKPMDLVAVVEAAVEVVRPSADARKLTLLVDAPMGTFPLVGDADRLQQVVWNLLANAVRFTDPGGSIGVSLRQEQSTAVMTVTDTGRGITAEFLPHVFERFRQADASITRRVGGLGLGLALVRHIVELHGGRVSASSEGLGKGATFTVMLPIRAVAPRAGAARTAPSEAAVDPARESSLEGLRVLVVDDEPDARDLVATVLREEGADVETAASVDGAFDAFVRMRPDVLVSDIGMPGEDGFTLIRRIRGLPESKGGKVPALALTAFARNEDRARALAAGYDAHLPKPVDPDMLARAVADLRPRR